MARRVVIAPPPISALCKMNRVHREEALVPVSTTPSLWLVTIHPRPKPALLYSHCKAIRTVETAHSADSFIVTNISFSVSIYKIR